MPDATSTRPRLAFVGPMLGRHVGRVPSTTETLAALLRDEGWDVRMASSSRNPLARAADITWSLARWRNDVDVVIVDVFSGRAFGFADLASAIVRAGGKPLVLSLHGGNLPEFGARHRRWVHRVLGRADALTAPSAYLQGFASSLGLSAKVVPNVVNIDGYPFRRRYRVEPHLLWMRAFHELYRPAMALAVARRVRTTLPAMTLTMAGQDSGLLGAIRQEADRNGLESSVSFPGFLGPERKLEELGAHDVFLNTNRVDNMPVSVLEALACGLPVVSTAVGGIPHLLEHEETGLLVDDGDAGAMAEAVVRIVREPSLAARLSANGRRLAERFDWPHVRARWEALLEDVLAA